jgi:site-specific DNA-methyltransferase (adenine-specific)
VNFGQDAEMTQTSAFGTSKRESHDSSSFYNRNLYDGFFASEISSEEIKAIKVADLGDWVDKIYNQSSTDMSVLPDNSIALAFTSPPYNVGKEYDDDINFEEYLSLIRNVGKEVYRVLRPGGRYVINIANLGRKPYIPLHSFFYNLHATDLGFLPMGEIIWQKGRGASNSCAWGSWLSAKAPRLRDVHEYLLVFAKQSFSRPDKGESTIKKDEFISGTLSIWEIPPESAKRVKHPAPFPEKLAQRVIELFSYSQDVVLDPFVGSGTTCVAAKKHDRHYVGFDISEEYCMLADERIAKS